MAWLEFGALDKPVKRGLSTLAALAVPFLLCFAAGCDSCRKPEPTAPEVASAAPSPSADAAPASPFKVAIVDSGAGKPPWADVPGATAATMPSMSVAERFKAELAARPPNATPNVESVFAALENAGLEVVDKKQHLAQSVGARYCVGARVVGGKDAGARELLVISVCEFVNAEVAAGSRNYSIESLKVIPNRTVHANKQTTMTVGESDPVTPATEAANAKALAAYDAL